MLDEGQFNIWLDIKNSNKKKKKHSETTKMSSKAKKKLRFCLMGFFSLLQRFFCYYQISIWTIGSIN
jgi:hypothetical protein